MEVRSYSMKYKVFRKSEKELLLNGLRAKIDEIQESNAEADVVKLEALKKVMQDVIDGTTWKLPSRC